MPGQSYEVDWPLQPTDYVFAAGHRISVTVAVEGTHLVLPVVP